MRRPSPSPSPTYRPAFRNVGYSGQYYGGYDAAARSASAAAASAVSTTPTLSHGAGTHYGVAAPGTAIYGDRARRLELQLASLKTGLVGLQRSLREAQAHLLSNHLANVQAPPPVDAPAAPAPARPASALVLPPTGTRPLPWTAARVLDQVFHPPTAGSSVEDRLAVATAGSLLMRGRRRLDPDATESSSGESDHAVDTDDEDRDYEERETAEIDDHDAGASRAHTVAGLRRLYVSADGIVVVARAFPARGPA